MNYRCGTGTNLSAFLTGVLNHEREHERSLNDCVSGSAGRAAIRRMEGVLGSTGPVAQGVLDREWRAFWRNDLRPSATGSIARWDGPDMWSYRFNRRWEYCDHDLGGHSGTHGC